MRAVGASSVVSWICVKIILRFILNANIGDFYLICHDGEVRNFDTVLAINLPAVPSGHASLIEGVIDESQNIDTLGVKGTVGIHQSAEVLSNNLGELLDINSFGTWEQLTSIHRRCIQRSALILSVARHNFNWTPNLASTDVLSREMYPFGCPLPVGGVHVAGSVSFVVQCEGPSFLLT